MEKRKRNDVVGQIVIEIKDLQILNGKTCYRFNFIPLKVMELKPEGDCHKHIKDIATAFHLKLKDAKYSKIVEQLNKNLREITIWLNKKNKEKLMEFLK